MSKQFNSSNTLQWFGLGFLLVVVVAVAAIGFA